MVGKKKISFTIIHRHKNYHKRLNTCCISSKVAACCFQKYICYIFHDSQKYLQNHDINSWFGIPLNLWNYCSELLRKKTLLWIIDCQSELLNVCEKSAKCSEKEKSKSVCLLQLRSLLERVLAISHCC